MEDLVGLIVIDNESVALLASDGWSKLTDTPCYYNNEAGIAWAKSIIEPFDWMMINKDGRRVL